MLIIIQNFDQCLVRCKSIVEEAYATTVPYGDHRKKVELGEDKMRDGYKIWSVNGEEQVAPGKTNSEFQTNLLVDGPTTTSEEENLLIPSLENNGKPQKGDIVGLVPRPTPIYAANNTTERKVRAKNPVITVGRRDIGEESSRRNGSDIRSKSTKTEELKAGGSWNWPLPEQVHLPRRNQSGATPEEMERYKAAWHDENCRDYDCSERQPRQSTMTEFECSNDVFYMTKEKPDHK